MTLVQAKKGSKVKIIAIPDGINKSQLMRMGISEGAQVICQEVLPSGPVILRCKRQEIAIGRKLAEGIVVQ